MPRRSSRLLFVHAHPDDETLATGIAMAHHVAAGDQVHLLTCTLGEEGEVITGDLRHLAADREDRLGPYRRGELREAMRVLGVHEQVLGEVGGAGSRYRDSGMAGTASTRDPRAFTRADAGQAGDLVRDVLREIRPDVVVTYDQHGGYGHPDHIQTHRVTRAAVAGTPRAQRPRLFCRLTPRSWAQADREWVRRHVTAREDPRVLLPGEADAYPAGVVQDEIVTHEVADPRVAPTRDRALREHLTQVRVYDGYYALSDDIAARLVDREGYALLDPDSGALYPLDGAGGPRPGLLG